MKRSRIHPKIVFAQIGEVQWRRSLDAFVVHTMQGARILLSPNSDYQCDSGVHIDEIAVPKPLRRQGVATAALNALCELADQHKFRLEGGPIGFTTSPWRDKFVVWVLRFGFESHQSPFLPQTDDPKAFYVQRLPRAKNYRADSAK
jgi:GNAT superfamily N-acetyltransferase